MHMDIRLQQEEPSSAIFPQICNGEEPCNGQAGFELVLAPVKPLVGDYYKDPPAVVLGPPHTSPLWLASSPGAQPLPCREIWDHPPNSECEHL